MIDTAATALFTFTTLWLLLGSLARLCYSLLQKKLTAIHPAQRSTLLLGYILLPLFIATIITTLLYLPPIALIDSHCHGSSCQQHGPQNRLAMLPSLLLGCLLLYRIASIYFRQLKPAKRLQNELRQLSQQRNGFREIESQKPAAFTLGWWSPSIYLSSGLLQQIDGQAQQCILHHEAGHRLRHDNLRQLLVQIACAPLPKVWIKPILSDHSLACELACDIIAANENHADDVAETLLKVSRLQTTNPSNACAFADSFTEQRVKALLIVPPPRLSKTPLLIAAATTAVVVFVLLNPLHTLLEHLVL